MRPRIPVRVTMPRQTPVRLTMPRRMPVRLPAPHAHAARTFTSTPAARALGPASPNYIDVPTPLQPTFALAPVVKGHLPVPRDVFKTRSAHPKHSDVFIARSTKPPQDPKAPGPHSKDAPYRLYKQRLAASRRAALRQGVQELHARKVDTLAAFQAKLVATYADKRARAFAPPRATDVLTATSLQKGLRDFLASSLPPSAQPARLPQRTAAYRRRMATVQATRASRLHGLYVKAREFIVDEDHLHEAIEHEFGTEDQPVGWDARGIMGPRADGHEGLSAFHGPLPEGTADKVRKLRGGEGVGLASDRLRKVAEELTGGKM
ncbi:hypothetical protein BDU57DRAFT_455684 [Ampelomyces quisqualis]|uniref:Uncharacterized protein n=1 Tax=Ampelomyces quisqualis TaxID=50730 RepID=A0A6A5QFD2_AMPQU|nr:hypothetical protein BDU57DRAFT_455684 [Ampelomyces quisqualis]